MGEITKSFFQDWGKLIETTDRLHDPTEKPGDAVDQEPTTTEEGEEQ